MKKLLLVLLPAVFFFATSWFGSFKTRLSTAGQGITRIQDRTVFRYPFRAHRRNGGARRYVSPTVVTPPITLMCI